MKLVETLKDIIVEQFSTLLKKYISSSGQKVKVVYNKHSQDNQGKLEFQRIFNDEVVNSLDEIKNVVFNQANKILNRCNPDPKKKECALIVRDNIDGFDYHFWLNRTKNNELVLTLNTSIRHPGKLFNTLKHNVIVVDTSGDTQIVESDMSDFTFEEINGKFVYYFKF